MSRHNPERQRQRYEMRKAAGECYRCRRQVGGGSVVYCEEHLIEQRKRVKRLLLSKLNRGAA